MKKPKPTKHKTGQFAKLVVISGSFQKCPQDFPGGRVRESPCNARDKGLIPGWGTKIPHATWHMAQPKQLKIERKKEICPQWS